MSIPPKPRRPSPPATRRGNATSGENRRGFKGGSKPLHPPGTVLTQVLLALTDEQAAIAVTLGEGVLTKGVRIALDNAGKALPPDVPRTRAEAQMLAYEKRIKASKARAAARAAAVPITRISKYGAPPSKEELARLMAFYKAKRAADQAAGVTEPADDEENEGKVLVGVQVIVPRVADELDTDAWDDLGSDEEPTT